MKNALYPHKKTTSGAINIHGEDASLRPPPLLNLNLNYEKLQHKDSKKITISYLLNQNITFRRVFLQLL